MAALTCLTETIVVKATSGTGLLFVTGLQHIRRTAQIAPFSQGTNWFHRSNHASSYTEWTDVSFQVGERPCLHNDPRTFAQTLMYSTSCREVELAPASIKNISTKINRLPTALEERHDGYHIWNKLEAYSQKCSSERPGREIYTLLILWAQRVGYLTFLRLALSKVALKVYWQRIFEFHDTNSMHTPR